MMKEEKNNFINFIKKSKYSIAFIVFFTLLAFGQRLLTTGFGIDNELYLLSIDKSEQWQWWFNLNRWGLVFLNKIFQMDLLSIYISNYLTVITMVFYAIGFNYLIYMCMKDEWKSTFLKYQFVFPILFLTNPIFAEQYNFLLQNFGVALGIFMIPLSLLLQEIAQKMENKTHKILTYTLAIGLAIWSFGIYQSILLLYVATVAIVYLLKVLNNNDNNWKFLLRQIGIFAISAFGFIMISKQLSQETSYLQMAWLKDSFGICILNIFYCVKSMIKSETIFYNIGYIVSIVIMLTTLFYYLRKRNFKIGLLIGILGVLCAPLYIMIVTGVDQFKRTQFNYSFTVGFVILFGIILLSKKNLLLTTLKTTLIVFAIGLAYIQSYTCANLFQTAEITYQTDFTFANHIVSEIQKQNWFEEEKEYVLIFLGKHSVQEKFAYVEGEIIGKSFFEFDYEYLYGVNSRANAFLQLLGYYFNEPSQEQFDMAKKYVLENNIPAWPKENAICLVNENTIIVRLSQEIEN